MVCTGCGIIGADARPNWIERPMREGDGRLGLAAVNWSRRLPRSIGYTKPTPGMITILHDARAHMLTLRELLFAVMRPC